MERVRVAAPRPRAPMPAELLPDIRDERVVVANEAGAHYGYRAWSSVYVRPDGASVIDVVTEEDWWRHRLLGTVPPFQRWPSGAVWAE